MIPGYRVSLHINVKLSRLVRAMGIQYNIRKELAHGYMTIFPQPGYETTIIQMHILLQDTPTGYSSNSSSFSFISCDNHPTSKGALRTDPLGALPGTSFEVTQQDPSLC